ncbi:MAG: NAD(P)/FAD-dependent oxidoreductase [Bacteriovorax sp.]|nr:NAD(P)/FAD-dependent oxidoreductase [Bacteriovorax sp.]
MTKKIQFTLDFNEDVETWLESHHPEMHDYRILNQALDARGAQRGKVPRYTYNIEILKNGEQFEAVRESFTQLEKFKTPPIIIGGGPGGLFCALRLADYGVPSIVIERGDRAHNRMLHIAKHWRYGEFNTENNVCYGEGGAGLFSDGKLITRIKSPFVQYVMNRFVDFGAPKETAYISNPHLGSNKIRMLINKMTEYLVSKGCIVKYNTRVDRLLVEGNKVIGVELNNGEKLYSPHVVLATGHSASEMYNHLQDLNVEMKQKDFAIGVRIEHPRDVIDSIQYGKFAGQDLGAARYRLSYEDPFSKKGTYSFCMCPGGYVLSSGTEKNGIVVNGMSNYARNSRWSNAALVVSVRAGVDFSSEKLLAGLDFQHKIEQRAYNVSIARASGRELPAQTLKEFMDHSLNPSAVGIKTSTPSGIVKTEMRDILPDFVTKHLENALVKFEENLKGFISDKALLIAPETRTSAPVTIVRNKETMESTSHQGLYPCGEGAGHAGGITSAAVDGVKIAMSLLKIEKGFEP